MIICIYAESIKVFSSGTPQRGMIKQLIKLRSDDEFIFVVRKEIPKNKVLDDFFREIKCFENVKFLNDKLSPKLTNLLFLFGLYKLASLKVKADIFLSLDIVCFGPKNQPIINLIADFSSINKNEISSLNFLGKQIRRIQYKIMVKYASYIVAISQYTLNILRSKSPLTQSCSSVVYNGISDKWFNIPISEGEPGNYLLWWGFISKRKNLDGLLAAYKNLLKNNLGDIPSLMIVSNNFEKTKKKTNSNPLLREKIIYLKSVEIEQLVPLIDKSVGVVFPSFYEGFGLPVIEAFSRGKQVLTSDVSALKEVTHAKAIYCDPYNIESIYVGLKSIIKNSDSLSSLLERKKIAHQYTYENSAKAFSELISKIVNERS